MPGRARFLTPLGWALLTVVDEGATHSEDAWAGRLPRALEFLYGDGGSRVAPGYEDEHGSE